MKTRTIKQLVFAIVAVAILLPMKALSATLSIENFTIKPGETKTMYVDVNNADMLVTMVEFYMYLPNGLSVATEDGDLAVDIAGRTTWKKHSLEAQMDAGVLHVFLYSGSNATLSGTSGAVISVKLTAASSFTGGNITLKQQLLAAPNEEESKPADYTYKVTTGVSDAVTLTARSYTRQYGEANPTFGYDVTSGSITSGTPTITCSATKTSAVGTYPIVISKGSVSNSDVTLVNGTLTITRAPLTVSAGNYTKQEGDPNPTFTPTFSGFKNNETKSVLTKQPTVTTTATTSSPAGTYLVTVSGAEAQNYSISYVNGTLTVTPKTVVGDNITFADAEVKRICVENWDTNGDGELSKAEAAAVTDIGTVFKENKIIKAFNELQYFTGLKSIVYSAFYKCSGLTSVTIPNSVTSIGQDAFSGCSGQTSVTIPNSVTSIGTGSFSDCSGLTSVTIPNSVTSIGWFAFSGCSGLTSVTIPNSVTSLDGTFKDCSGLTTVTIPSSVTSLNNTFSGCTGLTSVTIPSSVTALDRSFSGCTSLTSITIPKSVTSIGDEAFYGCNGLSSITIPSSVTSIGGSAFRGCSGLTSVTIPGSVRVIGNYAFSGCNGLTSVTIPNSVTSIGYEAFYKCSGLTTVSIGNSVTSIGGRAFSGCTGVKKVYSEIKEPFAIDENVFGLNLVTSAILYVPKGTKSKYQATDGWIKFTAIVEMENGNDIITFADPEVKRICVEEWDTNKDGELSMAEATAVTDLVRVFENNKTIKTFNELQYFIGLTSIGSSAFYGCNGLTSVTIPGSVRSIGSYAFQSCSGLISISIPNSVTIIEYNAFTSCRGLTSVTIGNGVTNIGSDAFSYCNSLTSITIPNSVTYINGNPFSGCSNLKEILVQSDNAYYTSSDNGVLFTKDMTQICAYPCARQGNSYTIPNTVKKIGFFAFYYCSGLTSVVIPGCVTSIGGWAFCGCNSLTSVTIPNSVTSIGKSAFHGCTSLNEVHSMIEQPFAIDDMVFQYYDNGQKFTSATLYVPKGTKALYQATGGWKNFTKIVETGGEEPAPEIVRNVVMEEATGTWCGWCIRGFVAMKQAKEQFGDRFIGIAVHSGDVMDIGSYYNLGLSSYPSCLIDRYGEEYDPSYLYVVENRMKVAPTAGVSVKGEWNADKTRVTATSETQFLADGDGYSVAYVLVADGLTGTSSLWNQNNAYSGRTSTDPDLQYYCNQGSPITDMVYNDVMVGSSYNSSGQNLATSFGGSVKKGDKKANSYTLSLPTSGELAAAIDKNQVYVVAIVTNPDGTIANAAKAKVGTGAKGDVNSDGVVDVADIATVISVMAKGNNDLSADVNRDGTVDVADIASVISIMAAKARRLNIED